MADRTEWRLIAEFPAYAVSSAGEVKRITPDKYGRLSGTPMKASSDSDGYLQVNLFGPNGKRTVKIHRAVCDAFHGPRPSGDHEVAHGDGARQNNRSENLRWATRKENAADRDLHGRTVRGDTHPARTKPGYLPTGDNHHWRRNPPLHSSGENHWGARLTEADVRAIRADPRKGVEIAAAHQITPTSVSNIKSRKTWKHVA